MLKKILTSKVEITKAHIERGQKQLFRLGIMMDVLYTLMIYKLFSLMPNSEINHFVRKELYKVLLDNHLNYTIILIGLVLLIIYWSLSNLQFGNLKSTNGMHSTLFILQVFSLMLYIY